MPSGKKLAIVVSHPTQYYSPWFRYLARERGELIRVFYLWDFGIEAARDPHFKATFKWDVDLLSGYEFEQIPNLSKDPGAEHFFGFNNPGLIPAIRAWGPDAILLFGYNWYSHMRMILWAKRRGIPLIFRGDSHLLGRPALSLPKRVLLSLLFRQLSAVAYVGEANRDYFRCLGVPDKKLFRTPHSVNDGLYDPTNPELREKAQALRSALGAGPSTRVVMFAGKFVPAKQPVELLEAFAAKDFPDSILVFVGDGELRSTLQERAAALPSGKVVFLPFANQSEMPVRYLVADLFVLPSRGVYETWGLSVNEAMHMGTPCLVSDRVGCQKDLVTDGNTGWVFQLEGGPILADKLVEAVTLLANPDQRARIKRALAERICDYTYARSADGLAAALAFVTGGPV